MRHGRHVPRAARAADQRHQLRDGLPGDQPVLHARVVLGQPGVQGAEEPDLHLGVLLVVLGRGKGGGGLGEAAVCAVEVQKTLKSKRFQQPKTRDRAHLLPQQLQEDVDPVARPQLGARAAAGAGHPDQHRHDEAADRHPPRLGGGGERVERRRRGAGRLGLEGGEGGG